MHLVSTVCPRCGGANVYVKVGRKPNGNLGIEPFSKPGLIEVYCRDCDGPLKEPETKNPNSWRWNKLRDGDKAVS
jgi:hypothetical protein